jgi:CMP-N-acetylneuraminic acid synthetase
VYTLGIIPARGGSKRVPRKNIKDFCGKPLIAWTIDAALKSTLDEIIVSTDDPETRGIAQDLGAWAPFLRPDILATDYATSIDVVLHALLWMKQNRNRTPINVVLLQPTSPLRTYKHVNLALRVYKTFQLDSLVSGKYQADGAIYIASTLCIYDNKSFVSEKHRLADLWGGEPMPDIDTEQDWKEAERLMCLRSK